MMIGVHFPLERIPRDLSRPARTALFAICLNCNEETGEVEATETHTAQQLIAAWCGWDKMESLRASLAELEAHRLVSRVGKTRGASVFLLVLGRKGGGICEVCSAPVSKLDGAKKCATCQQLKRREWKGDAMEIWRALKMKDPPWGDMKIANHIALRLKRSMWGYRDEDVQGSGSGDGEGVIPALVAARMFPPEMLRLCTEARGAEIVTARRAGEQDVNKRRGEGKW